tara:strand:- start:6491 stop:7309 length:819 start_codon:yes stop_codon:yes gene_type:complete
MIQYRELIKKIIASNGSVFTGDGTNTYLIGKSDITIVDPGPNIDHHVKTIIKEVGDNAKRILVTHTHRDHSPAAKVLGDSLNIPLYGMLVAKDDSLQDKTFKPNELLKHGDIIKTDEYEINVIHTPGHASNHLCYLIPECSVLLTGDHIMNGSTVVIAPPDGNMQQYLSSLKLLKDYDFDYIGPGHGDFLSNPIEVVNWIINHRMEREKKIIKKLSNKGACNIDKLVKAVYDDVDSNLHPIALWSLQAHLEKLRDEDQASYDDQTNSWSIKA